MRYILDFLEFILQLSTQKPERVLVFVLLIFIGYLGYSNYRMNSEISTKNSNNEALLIIKNRQIDSLQNYIVNREIENTRQKIVMIKEFNSTKDSTISWMQKQLRIVQKQQKYLEGI